MYWCSNIHSGCVDIHNTHTMMLCAAEISVPEERGWLGVGYLHITLYIMCV